MGFYHLFDIAGAFNYLWFRCYTYFKATEQQAPPNSTDLEALDKAKGAKFEGDDRQMREKATLSD